MSRKHGNITWYIMTSSLRQSGSSYSVGSLVCQARFMNARLNGESRRVPTPPWISRCTARASGSRLRNPAASERCTWTPPWASRSAPSETPDPGGGREGEEEVEEEKRERERKRETTLIDESGFSVFLLIHRIYRIIYPNSSSLSSSELNLTGVRGWMF